MSDTPTPPPIGSDEDIVARQLAVLPPWWGDDPLLRAVLRMPSRVGAWIFALLAYVEKQSRIKTADGGWLDKIAWDFFGNRVRRRAAQPDESFRRRILIEMFRPRVTRPAMRDVLLDLTGREPRIFEPNRPADTGGIGHPTFAIGRSGAIGSLAAAGNVFIDVYRDPDAGIPFAAGIGVPSGGIGRPSRLVIGSLDRIRGALTDADVYAAINATRPAGIRVWVRLHF